MNKPVKGRFAPSPSGRMHLGNIFSALMAYASARSQGGSFVVRLEDIDDRCKDPKHSSLLLEDLSWLGIVWDEDPIAQRSRTEVYEEALDLITEKAKVYPCFCSRADLHSTSAPHASDGTLLYAGTCKGLKQEQIAEKQLLRNPALRIEVPQCKVSFEDKHLGYMEQDLQSQCGDFVLRRSDGAFAYQLVVVVDDSLSDVTEVVRGADLATSTPRQIWLQSLLGYAAPEYAHHPVLMAADGRRLSKREKSLDMGVLRQSMSPEEIIGLVGFLAGIFDSSQPALLCEFIDEFSWDRVAREDIVFDLDSLPFLAI